MSKREPHIIDCKLIGYEPSVRRVQAHASSARRFVFGEEASAFVGRFVKECGDVVLYNRQFALPPLPITYVEFNARVFYETLGSTLVSGSQLDRDEEVAFLLVRNHVYILAGGTRLSDNKKERGVSPFEYVLNTTVRSPNLFSKDTSEEGWRRAQLLMGTTLNAAMEREDLETVTDIVSSNDILVPGHAQLRPERQSLAGMSEIAKMSYGDLRNVWVFLLMINQPRHGVTSTHVPHQVGLLRGKRHVYAAHSVVSISLSEREYRRPAHSLGFATRESPRRHGVRGHFLHYRGHEGCEHAWPFDATVGEDNVLRWTCTRCGRLRVWREAFHRGDASKGFTTNEYELTT